MSARQGFRGWPVKNKNKAEITMNALLNSLRKYFPSISVDQYNWVRNPFVEFEPCQRQFTLKEEEELVSSAIDSMLELKHAELNLGAFWILVENEYPAIAEKAL